MFFFCYNDSTTTKAIGMSLYAILNEIINFFPDAWKMNEAGSAGGGQKGHVPAPPAVFSDRRSNYSGTTQVSYRFFFL